MCIVYRSLRILRNTNMMHLAYLSLWLSTLSSSRGSFVDGIFCPGVLQDVRITDSATDGSCCVGGELTLSNCLGWPICTGPTSFNPGTTTLSCATVIPLSASDYRQLISSASVSFFGSQQVPATVTSTSGERHRR